MRTLLLVGSLILLTNCADSGAAGCEAWRPVLVGNADTLTPETARAILAHNLTGRRLCGW